MPDEKPWRCAKSDRSYQPPPVAQADLNDTAEALLAEWGACQRREPSPGPRGYPRESTIYKAMRQRSVRRRRRRRVTGVHVHVPATSPAKRQQGFVGDWPEHIQAVDQVIATMSEKRQGIAVAYYAQQAPVPMIAQRIGTVRTGVYHHLKAIRAELAECLELTDDAA